MFLEIVLPFFLGVLFARLTSMSHRMHVAALLTAPSSLSSFRLSLFLLMITRYVLMVGGVILLSRCGCYSEIGSSISLVLGAILAMMYYIRDE